MNFPRNIHRSNPALERFVKLDKGDFIGREALLRRQNDIKYRYITLTIDAKDADAAGGEPILCNGEAVGIVTSGGYGHNVGQSIALGYVTTESLTGDNEFSVEIIGEPYAAELQSEALFDPQGLRMRA